MPWARTAFDAATGRTNSFTPRSELFTDTIRACDKLSDAIEGVLARLG